MRSKTSCFNRSFARSLLRRFWPLWALWLVLLLLVGVGDPLGYAPESYASASAYAAELNRVFLETGVALVWLSAAAGPLMAMAMLGYLYHPRACNMVCALPLRREETYYTAALTGLAPMLLADGLVYLIILALFGRVEGVAAANIHTWLGLVLLGNTAFYGLACFCGVLTGNVVVLPLVYVVLGCAASVVENTAQAVLEMLVYGYRWDGQQLFRWLAPLPCVGIELQVLRRTPEEAFRVVGVPYLAGLCGASLVLLLLGAAVLKRRHMECAGDIVAVPVLRPIFRVCMAVGGGLVLTAFASDAFFGNRPPAAAVFLLLIVGAALGWFIAGMLVKKTLRVFGSGWKQLGVICACLVLPFLLAELDATGYERRVPDPAELASAAIGYGETNRVTEPESLAAFCDFHRELVERKSENEAGRRRSYTSLPLTYTLKDGGTLTRLYRIPNDNRAQADPASELAAYQALMNLPELILSRAGADRDLRPETILHASLTLTGEDGAWAGSRSLTPEQAVSLFEEGILPDAREGTIARWYAWLSEQALAEESSVTVDVEFVGEQADAERQYHVYADASGVHSYTVVGAKDPRGWLNLNVLTCSAHTIRWLEENLGVTPTPRALASLPFAQ